MQIYPMRYPYMEACPLLVFSQKLVRLCTYFLSFFSWYVFINIHPDSKFIILKSITVILPLFPSKCYILLFIFWVCEKCCLFFMHSRMNMCTEMQ